MIRVSGLMRLLMPLLANQEEAERAGSPWGGKPRKTNLFPLLMFLYHTLKASVEY